MTHDKITLAIKELRKFEEELKGIKKDIKKEEKIEDDKYLELKRALKQLKEDVKYMEEEHLDDLRSSDFYGQLREAQLGAEEKVANKREELFKLLDQLPMKAFEMSVDDSEEGPVKIQAHPQLRVFVNGKEVKLKK